MAEKQEGRTKSSFEELSKLYLFDELYKFVRESTGLAIASAYLVLILSSTAYLYLFFDAFDISIVKYVTFEDILATPIKNPDIILILIVMIGVLYGADIGNRYRARQQIKYAEKEKPFGFKVLQFILWAPRNKAANLKVTICTILIILAAYIFMFATLEAKSVKEGRGTRVELTLADSETPFSTTLLGTSVNYVFTYDHLKNEPTIYYLEAIKFLKKLPSQQESASKANAVSSTKETQSPAKQ